jgi:hypothetical protein
MQVDVEVECGAETLDERDDTGLAAGAAQEARDGIGDCQHRRMCNQFSGLGCITENTGRTQCAVTVEVVLLLLTPGVELDAEFRVAGVNSIVIRYAGDDHGAGPL